MSVTVSDYTVAWICALPLEMAAAKAVHSNVAIACLPSGVYGTVSAATVLSHMLSTFLNLRFGLMVGIGGGVPRKNTDIRLGDVVVSMPNMSSGEVVQYDFGKALRDEFFQPTGSLNKPPQFLLTALSQLRSNHFISDRHIIGAISRTLDKYPDMKRQFSRLEKDWLFRPEYGHQNTESDCSSACDVEQLVMREPRSTNEPCIHYGLIASNNQVMKDAIKRDSIVEQMDILCFEMEASSLVDQLPCLWQGFVALIAAVYASALLMTVSTHVRAHQIRGTEPHWMVPLQRNLEFVGREEEINRIEDIIDGPPAKIAICGLERYSTSVLWIQCTNHEAVEQAFTNISQLLGVYVGKPADSRAELIEIEAQSSNVKLEVKRYLEQDKAGKWLMLFDNAEIAVNLSSPHVFHVSEPETEAASQILKTTMILLKQLAFLPLAIIQAAAYVNRNIISFSDYIELMQEQESDVIELLSEDSGDECRYREIHNPRIQLLDELAADYLSFMACIHTRDTPLLLLPEASSRVKRTNAIDLLKAFSFISEQVERFSLHRLVHLSTRNWLRNQQRFGQQVNVTAARFAAVFTTHDDANRKLWREYLPHIIPLFGEPDSNREQHMELIQGVGKCLRMDGRYNDALPFFEAILRICKTAHGDTDNRTLARMTDLGWVYRGQGRWTEAEKLELQVLEIRNRMLEPDHPDTLATMTNLANTCSDLGKWQEAETLREQVLAVQMCKKGPEYPETLTSMSNLAGAYSKLGKWEEAEVLRENVLGAHKRSHGLEHPRTLRSMRNLASTYLKRHRYEEAEALEIYVLATSTRELGLDHPYTLTKYEGAEELARQALEGRTRVLGPEHAYTLKSMKTLSQVLRAQGKLDEAMPLMQMCFDLRTKLLGPDHPKFKPERYRSIDPSTTKRQS
ncbi:hypothetical protein BJX64DRAFT_299707 [Aspergillus heterothallicus]